MPLLFAQVGKSLLRRTDDGRVLNWNVDDDDSLCTLQEAFEKIDPRLGFNIELKFIDHAVYLTRDLTRALEAVLKVVYEHANGRPIIFSTFQPDAAQLLRKLQTAYPTTCSPVPWNQVFFLTTGGTETSDDVRRNSLDEAIKLCLASGLQGIVSDVKGVFRNPSAVPSIKASNLSLLTYGRLNNVPEAVYLQHLMGVDGVIVDLVEEITEAVSDFITPTSVAGEPRQVKVRARPNFSQRELSFLLKLVPELVQH
ncbi:Glycerophosphoryl diester phosphodiesterase family [Musa troglodytarum]|uniref:glycerophosphodiester phosphodiesterase n=1 Tax=Musa troglodytarum TaxID=320322 RepID=A0A9E7L0V0_9LILI|nr:Glycerophosphoryl diester phosphodiesterase family [Musa troglodytarum]